MPEFRVPPVWTSVQLETARLDSIARFVSDRAAEGVLPYINAHQLSANMVREFFAASADLANIPHALLSGGSDAMHVARFLTGPPTSADDLDTLVGSKVALRGRLPEPTAYRVAEVLTTALDPIRFPWIPGRSPTSHERDSALKWTAGLMAVQLVQTSRRSQLSIRQQEAVRITLSQSGFRQVERRTLSAVAEILPGEFMDESRVANAKCDVPVGLHDGRLLLIECKVSNSSLNSIKRLIRETVGKRDVWNRVFGERAITAAVLAGVFDLKHLEEAQRRGVTLFWEGDLQPLAEFVQTA